MTEQSTEDIQDQTIQVPEYDDRDDIMQTLCSEETECLNKVTKFAEGSTSDVPEHI
jgi:hypothetical protein